MAIVPLPGMESRPASRAAGPPIRRTPWREHSAYLDRVWQPGGTEGNAEANDSPHVSLIAPTGTGKTYLVTRGLLPLWGPDYRVLFFDFKDDDPVLRNFATKVSGFPNFAQRAIAPRDWYRVSVPSLFKGATRQKQGNLLYRALKAAYNQKDWLLVIDELRVPLRLGLEDFIIEIWERGRTQRVTLIADTQRPGDRKQPMPGHFFDQAGHVYLAAGLDHRTRQRIREIGGNDLAILRALPGLQKREFLYVGERGNRMEIVKVGR